MSGFALRNRPPKKMADPPPLTRLEKAQKFAVSLRRELEPFHEYPSTCEPARVPHFVTSLNRREMGLSRSPDPDDQIYQALLHSDTREFRPAELIKLKGSADYSNRRVIHAKSREMISFQDLSTFLMGGLMSTERVVATLLCPNDFTLKNGSPSPCWLMILTDLGRFIVYDVNTAERKYIYQLPAHSHKFRKLSWNKANDEICIYGSTIPQHIDEAANDVNARQSFCDKRVVLAVFTLCPMQFKAMFELDKKLFSNAYSAVLDDDIIMSFCSSPHKIAMYSFDRIYKECCVQPTLEGNGYEKGEKIVPFNLLIEKEPKKIVDIKGNFSSIFFGGSSFMLLEPANARETYTLRYMKDPSRGPLLGDIEMHGPSGGCSFTVELSSVMCSHPDSSLRLLRFEGIHLACYDVQRVLDGSGESVVRFSWKTALMPGRRSSTDGIWPVQDVRGRVGRNVSSRPIIEGHRNDGAAMNATTVRVLEMNYSYDNVLSVLVTYDVSNLGSPTSSGVEADSDWVSLIFLLNSITGRIIRIVPVKIYAAELELEAGNFRQCAELDEELIACSSYDGKSTAIETYRLTEPAQKLWEDEKQKPPVSPFVPSTLNRKERRKRRARSRQTVREESDSDWTPRT